MTIEDRVFQLVKAAEARGENSMIRFIQRELNHQGISLSQVNITSALQRLKFKGLVEYFNGYWLVK